MAKVENKVTEKVTNKKEENLENTSLVKLDDFKSVDEMMKFAKHLIDSKLLPIAVNTPEKVVTMIQLGKELGVGSVSALTNIHVIDGRPTLGVHLIGALIRKAGIKYSLIEDFKSITDKDGKSTGNRKTTIRFYEKWNGKVIETDFSFTTQEAEAQGLLTKSNWKKLPKIMLRNRTLALGGRFVAPEALMGLLETSEALDLTNKEYSIVEDGTVTILEDSKGVE